MGAWRGRSKAIILTLSPNEDELLNRALARDPEALDSLFAKYLPELRSFVSARLGQALAAREERDDIVQSACREVLMDLTGFRGGGLTGFRAWLLLAATRKIVDRARYWNRQLRRDAPGTADGEVPDADLRARFASLLTPSRVAIGREELASFDAAFEQLSEEQRDVVTSSKLLGLGHAEIGLAMGRSEGAVRVMLHRALAKLGRLLEEGSTQ